MQIGMVLHQLILYFPSLCFIVGSAIYFSVRGLSQLTFADQSKKFYVALVLLICGFAILLLIVLVKLEQSAVANTIKPVYHFFENIGKNPLFIYVLSEFLATTLYLIPVGGESAYAALYGAFRTFADPYLASLLFALLMVGILWFVAWVLHKRNIIISL